MSEWHEMYEKIIGKIDSYLKNQGWSKNSDGEWNKMIAPEDPSQYIGDGPLASIINGQVSKVYGEGAEGVSNFIAETYVSEFEENYDILVGLSDDEQIWLEDEDNCDEISSYIQGFMCPSVDVQYIEKWIESKGY